mmetsp:Transcript_73430/g.144116  ORF Transcript_73430/g.144116 Transcript_73430/m.144116 type:complete len:134 (+) Transcript_73430:210-611(+)
MVVVNEVVMVGEDLIVGALRQGVVVGHSHAQFLVPVAVVAFQQALTAEKDVDATIVAREVEVVVLVLVLRKGGATILDQGPFLGPVVTVDALYLDLDLYLDPDLYQDPARPHTRVHNLRVDLSRLLCAGMLHK